MLKHSRTVKCGGSATACGQKARVVRCRAQQQPVHIKPEHIAAGVLAASCLCSSPALAAQNLQDLAEMNSTLTFAVGGGAAVAGLGALLVATDPQKR